jgi:hypothetical protein
MKIYKVHIVGPADQGSEHNGYYYTSNKRDAYRMSNKNDPEALKHCGVWDMRVQAFDVKLNKKSILQFLNAQCSHPDNG